MRAVQTAVARTSPDIAADVRPGNEEMAQNVTLLRRLGLMLGGLGVFGLTVALVSLYGVIAYVAQQRSREIAIRKALGATPTTLWRMLSLDAVLILLRGLLPGLFISVLAGVALSRSMPGIPAVDTTVLAFVGSCITLTGLGASVAPFRRSVYAAPPNTELRAI